MMISKLDEIEQKIVCTPRLRVLAMFAVAAILFAVTNILGVKFFLDVRLIKHTPPVTIHKVEVINAPLTVGENLKVRITRTKTRTCPATSLQYATNDSGLAYDLPVITRDSISTETEVVTEYETSGLPPGQYNLHVSFAYLCDGYTFAFQQPSVLFKIAE